MYIYIRQYLGKPAIKIHSGRHEFRAIEPFGKSREIQCLEMILHYKDGTDEMIG